MNRVDNHNVHGRALWLELQPELLLERHEERRHRVRRTVGLRRCRQATVRSVLKIDVVTPLKSCSIRRVTRLPEWLDFVAAGAILALAGGLAWQAGLAALVVNALRVL